MKNFKELKADLKLAKINKCYHQKQMEYFEEEQALIEEAIKEGVYI